jgi:two-component system, NarL family, sensor histidine kinase UhpB
LPDAFHTFSLQSCKEAEQFLQHLHVPWSLLAIPKKIYMLYSKMIVQIRAMPDLLKQHLTRPSIFLRILLGNTLIVCTGAIFGTLLTRHLTGIAADQWLIALFAAAGTFLTIIINIWILRTSLSPLRRLRESVHRHERSRIEAGLLNESDPDISHLASTLDALLLQLDERSRQLSAISERLLAAQEEERKNIARSLHDDTAQSLAMMILNLERIEKKLPRRLEQAAPPLDQVHLDESLRLLEATRLQASRTLKELRGIVQGLRPSVLDDLGLLPAIRWYARSVFQESSVQVHINASETEIGIPTELAGVLFRIAQEAINNIEKHAGASCVSISLNAADGWATMRVDDDGCGFDVSQAARQALSMQRLGLLGLQERAAQINGTITIDSAPGKGTRLRVDVPLP